MDTHQLFEPLSMPRGPTFKNRLALAPLTNLQSHEDGRLSDAEIHWLTMRAQGGFAMTMTAAGYVQRKGRGAIGQLRRRRPSAPARRSWARTTMAS